MAFTIHIRHVKSMKLMQVFVLLSILLVNPVVTAAATAHHTRQRVSTLSKGGHLRHDVLFLKAKHNSGGNSEPVSEKREERLLDGTHEEQVLHSAMGAPHEGHGLDQDVPSTIAEDQIEGNHAINSVHALAASLVVPSTGIFLLCILLGNMLTLTKWTKWIPESLATLTASVILGLFLHQLMARHYIEGETFTLVNSVMLNLFLLPIIIFQSGWCLRRSDFMSQFEYILVFAILGTLISTFFIAFVSYGLASLGLHEITDLRSNFAFAALISAVDPVATLSTYHQLGVEPLLNIMVFGESTINDAVAIVLFNVINENWDNLSYLSAAWRICVLLFGSMGFGTVVSTILIVFMRFAKMTGHTHGEVLYVWTCAFFIFALAESLHFSGIIANLFAGIVFGIYARRHLTEQGERVCDTYLKLSAATADNCVFVLCGTSTAMMNSLRGFEFGLLALVMCLVARLFSVFPCGVIVNAMKSMQGEPNILSWQKLVMMWHSGLRGGIALVLALEVNGQWCEHKAMIVNGTFVVICTCLFILGGSTEVMLRFMGVETHVQAHEDVLVVKDRYYVKLFNGMDYVGCTIMGNPKKAEVAMLEEDSD